MRIFTLSAAATTCSNEQADISDSRSDSSSVSSDASPISPAFSASARPQASCFHGSVVSVSGSISTFFGCQKVPTMFLTPPRSTAVFPPTELSTWDRSVVGKL